MKSGEDLEEAWNHIVKKLKNLNKIKEESVNRVLHTYGNLEDNTRNLICPRCRTKYIGTHMYCVPKYDNELSMKKVGLHDNPLEYKSADINAYYCLCCGYGWTSI